MADQTECLLLSLPPEIRSIIWELALATDFVVAGIRRHARHSPHLLATCRQVQQEAGACYYSSVTFVMAAHDANTWLQTRRPQTIKQLRRVRISSYYFPKSIDPYDQKMCKVIEDVMKTWQVVENLEIEFPVLNGDCDAAQWVTSMEAARAVPE